MEERTRLKNVGPFFWHANECKVICKSAGLGSAALAGRMRHHPLPCWPPRPQDGAGAALCAALSALACLSHKIVAFRARATGSLSAPPSAWEVDIFSNRDVFNTFISQLSAPWERPGPQ